MNVSSGVCVTAILYLSIASATVSAERQIPVLQELRRHAQRHEKEIGENCAEEMQMKCTYFAESDEIVSPGVHRTSSKTVQPWAVGLATQA